MIDEAKPTIAEKYATASETSDMRVTQAPCPADTILAAAFSRDHNGNRNTAGATFARLRSEFDQAHAEVRHEARGQNLGVADERMLVMMRLKSLKAAKVYLLAISDARASRRGTFFAPQLMPELTWQALSAWLDDRCAPCGGRGFTGGYDGPQVPCRKCNAGNRRGFVGKNDSERTFVSGLICDIEEAIQRFEVGMSIAKRGG